MIERQVVIRNRAGLHTRPAATLVKVAAKFKAEFMIEKAGFEINGKSIIGVMTLAAEQGSELTLRFDGEDEEEGVPHRGAGRKVLIIVLLAVTLLLLSVIGGVLYFFGLLDPILGIEETVPEGEETQIKGQVFYKLEDFTLNLSTEGQKSQFMKVGITIVLMNEAEIARVEALTPRIQDNVTAFLRELKAEELAGSANFQRLRQNILLRVRTAVAPTEVTNVLFHSALVQ